MMRFYPHPLASVLALLSLVWLCAMQTLQAQEDDIAIDKYYHAKPCRVDFSDDGTLLATIGSANKWVSRPSTEYNFFGIWEWANSSDDTKLKITIPIEYMDNSCAVAFSPDNTLIAASHGGYSSKGGYRVTLFDVATGDTVRTFWDLGIVRDIDFSPDGTLLAVGNRSAGIVGNVHVFDVATGELVYDYGSHFHVHNRLDHPFSATGSVAFSLDGTQLAATACSSGCGSDGDGLLHVWDVETWLEIRRDRIARPYSDGRYPTVEFSPDGTLFTPMGVIAFSPHGKFYAQTRVQFRILDELLYIRVFETASEKLLGEWLIGRSVLLPYLVFTPDGTSVLYRGDGGYIRRLRVFDPVEAPKLPAVQNQVFPIGKPIVPLELPEFSGGVLPITYELTPTTMPAGLFYDVPTRTILGIPTEVTSMDYTYTATDARKQTATIEFNITVSDDLTDDPLTALESIAVEPENRCTEYDRDDYSYSQSIEPQIVVNQGGMFSPYDGTCFNALQDSDIEHIVATSEAHDSGMCSQSKDKRTQYASDLLNLTLATPTLNRHEKGAKDFAEWQPPQNGCWYAARIIEVKEKYGLSVDQAEYDSLNATLNRCSSVGFEMEIPNCGTRVNTETEPVFDDPGLHVYPNPVSHTIWFTAEGDIRLFDLLGREVLNQHGVMVNVSHLPAGVYLYRLTADTHEGIHVRSGHFVKVR